MNKRDLAALKLKENATETEFATWMETLMLSWDLNFHPDDPAENYVGPDDTKVFTEEEARILNESRKRAFKLFGEKFYSIGSKVQDKVFEQLKILRTK